MADLPETSEWTAGIHQWEISDPIEGGAEGIDNLPTRQLANRTKWLKEYMQPKSLLLGALAGLASLANKIPYFTGQNQAAMLDLDNDVTLVANSDSRIATQKAVKGYADTVKSYAESLFASNDAMVFKGVIDCTGNPNYPAADCGHTYRVSVAGKIGGAAGVAVEVGDILTCIHDSTVAGNHAAAGGYWTIIQANIDGSVIYSDLQNQRYTAFFTAGTSGVFTLNPNPAITAYAENQRFHVKFHAAGNGADTINVSGLGAKNLKQYDSIGAKASPVIAAGQLVDIEFDGIDFVLLAPLPVRGIPAGTPLMWMTPDCPNWALVRDGSAISRASYATLFAALCPTRNGTTTNGSNAVTGLSRTTDLYVGMPVEGIGIPAGATVAAITSGTAITLSVAATASATVPIRLFYYGYGASGNATTFGVPDDRGLAERGLDTGAKGYDKSAITGTTTNGNASITGLSSTSGLFVGMAISGTGVPVGATITTIASATAITISSAATASGTVTLTVTGRQIGSYQQDMMQGHRHLSRINNSHGYTSGGTINDFVAASDSGTTTNAILDPITDGSNGTPSVGPETRGKNRAYLPIIVY